MTSASSSDGGGRRNLAVYRVPAPPAGWEGHDLVRIVDALGLAVAWLSTALAGSVIALHLRSRVESPWYTVAGPDAASPTIRIDPGRAPWTLVERDPVAATFTNGDRSHRLSIEDGILALQVPATSSIAGPFDPALTSSESRGPAGRLLQVTLARKTAGNAGNTERGADRVFA